MKVLVTFATVSGSTREIAQFIHRELVEQGVNAEIRPCREVNRFPAEYDAVVLGAPLYMFHLHGDALHFLKRHQKLLASIPVAVFAGGAYGPNSAEDSIEVRKNLDTELARLPWLRPASVHLVGGRFDPALLRFPYNLIPALKQQPPSDVRDWEDIRAWARHLPHLLSGAQVERAAS